MNRSSSSLSSLVRGTSVGALAAILIAYTGCSSSPATSFGDGDDDGDASSATDDGGSGNDSASSSDGHAAADSSSHDSGSTADSMVADTSTPDTSTPDTGTITSSDGFATVRTACINEINRLRATQSLPPYTLVNTTTINTCVDGQATSDEASGVAHQAWESGVDACNGNGQDECEGYGNTTTGIVQCLDAMWNEKNNSDCAGCIGCQDENGCANCNFSGGPNGNPPECGHYVNMSAVWFTSVACGFAAAPGTWSAQNFFQ